MQSELIINIKKWANDYKLKYSYYNTEHYEGHRLAKDRHHYVELLIFNNGHSLIYHRNGWCGGGGYDATIWNFYSTLYNLGFIPKFEQMSFIN